MFSKNCLLQMCQNVKTCMCESATIFSILCIITLNPYSCIQQFCNRRLWNHLWTNVENLYKSKYNNWIELKTLLQMEKLFIMSNFSFYHFVFKRRVLQKELYLVKGYYQFQSIFVVFGNLDYFHSLFICESFMQNSWTCLPCILYG